MTTSIFLFLAAAFAILGQQAQRSVGGRDFYEIAACFALLAIAALIWSV